ncbi:MAG: right-handed parallel beta-helix repeat-containing protein [Planctomycetes bacterium]|nr:right-handed parallel beta-helix repeat-containing protein [Planctomycetota bacterium]
MPGRLIHTFVVVLCVFLVTAATSATVYNVNPGMAWESILEGSGLGPGDEVVMADGTYSSSSMLIMRHQGTAENPVVIRAADGATPRLVKSVAGKNGIDIQGAQYMTLRGLEITQCDSGIRIFDYSGRDAKFITIEDCYVHHTVGNAITANGSGQTYEGMIFRNNEIAYTGGHGEGFYLGSNTGTGLFHDSIVEGNHIHHLNGPTVNQGDGVDLKVGCYNNIIRNNVIHDTGYPALTIGGTLGRAQNIIEGNIIWNTGDHGIQVDSDAIIRNNIIAGGISADSIRVMSDQGGVTPGNLIITNNTAYCNTAGMNAIRIQSTAKTYSSPIYVANNALYDTGAGEAVRADVDGVDIIFVKNVGQGGVVNGGGGSLTLTTDEFDPSGNYLTDFVNAVGKDFYPTAASVLIGAGDAGYLPADDFNQTLRAGMLDAGAYRYEPGGNPGWIVVEGFKIAPTVGDTDRDGDIDAVDLAQLGLNWAPSATTKGWSHGNFDHDGDVDATDLAQLGLNWAPSGYGSIPEPATAAILVLGALGIIRTRRR